jgi:hypothetical protein
MKIELVSIPVPVPVTAFKYYTETQIAIVASPEDPLGV